MKEGGEAAHRAKRGVRQAVVRAAEVVACTLSSAGGDLLSLVKGPGADPSFLFNAIMIDEVQNGTHCHCMETCICMRAVLSRECCAYGSAVKSHHTGAMH